jgi:tryptophan-rich sensory protein
MADQVRIPVQSTTSYRGRNARPNWIALLGFIAAALAAGALGMLVSPARSASIAAWYAGLSKPAWTAPSGAFAPVWTALYLMMATAAWLVSRERYHRRQGVALGAYSVQLLLNAAWAPLFFGARNVGGGLFDIVALWLAVAWTLREFFSVQRAAACLLVPYWLWVTYAMALNFSLWRLNQ